MNKPTENKVVTTLKVTAQEQFAITATFEENRLIKPETGEWFWSARTLMLLLGYKEWRKFLGAIERAMKSCETNGDVVSLHFVGADKMQPTHNGGSIERQDYELSRYACYLIAMNGDSRKPEIAAAQRYFAVKTRRAEIADAASSDEDRIATRATVATSEVALYAAIESFGGGEKEQKALRSSGDSVLFNHRTADMKAYWWHPDNDALSDILPMELLIAKIWINNRTAEQTAFGKINNIDELTKCHEASAAVVRRDLIRRNLTPELMRPLPDIGSVTEELNTNMVKGETKIHIYKSFLTEDNITGYVGVERVDGLYTGTISRGSHTEPYSTKHHAVLAATAGAAKANTNNPGARLKSLSQFMVPPVRCIAESLSDPELEYLLSGYFTRILNNMDTIYIGDILASRHVNITEVHRQLKQSVMDIRASGYFVVEQSLTSGLIISVYT